MTKDFEYSMALDTFMEETRSQLGMPYIWGGDDFSGLDCSGSVVKCLKAIGYIGLGDDFTADGLWKRYKSHETYSQGEGYLIFWLDKHGKAYHVAICKNQTYCYTFDGGGSHVKTVQDSIKYNASMKLRRIDHRGNVFKVINLFRDKPKGENNGI